ncbi:type III pantothenate kinase [Stutzerimonas urumqiensis]|uniref:type III pantothenate kinase n=1 Tax=Stutzerimonas urumqiensis TaxID=638269 RepID=UPI003BAC42BE
MILELDCGNSAIKWRLMDGAGLVVHRGRADDLESLIAQIVDLTEAVSRCRLVSVRGLEQTKSIVDGIRALGVRPEVVTPSAALRGVVNGYDDYSRLGLDRWLALVAAFNRCRAACLVIDIGTAVTVDYVDTSGRHLGGYIAPGLPMLRRLIVKHAASVSLPDLEREALQSNLAPARSTSPAVESGCYLMLRAFLNERLSQADSELGSSYRVFVTGGDAVIMNAHPKVIIAEDLVLDGLALALP